MLFHSVKWWFPPWFEHCKLFPYWFHIKGTSLDLDLANQSKPTLISNSAGKIIIYWNFEVKNLTRLSWNIPKELWFVKFSIYTSSAAKYLGSLFQMRACRRAVRLRAMELPRKLLLKLWKHGNNQVASSVLKYNIPLMSTKPREHPDVSSCILLWQS